MKNLSLIFFIFVFHSFPCEAEEFALYELSRAIYFEAAGEKEIGWRVAGRVIINRYNNPYFPNTIRGVIYQPHRSGDDKTKCQFSFTCDSIPDVVLPQDALVFDEIVNVAYMLLRGDYHSDITLGADHYLRCDVINKTKWDWSKLEFTVRVNNHCFFKQVA